MVTAVVKLLLPAQLWEMQFNEATGAGGEAGAWKALFCCWLGWEEFVCEKMHGTNLSSLLWTVGMF